MTELFDDVGGAATDYTTETGIQKIREGSSIVTAALHKYDLDPEDGQAVIFGMSLQVAGGAHFVQAAYTSLFRTLGYSETDIRMIQEQTMMVARNGVQESIAKMIDSEEAETEYDEDSGLTSIYAEQG